MGNESPTPDIINKFVSVKRASEFETTLLDIFKKYSPRKIIETGTYFGTGTTSIIASAIRDLNIKNTEFYSIEVHPENIVISAENLKKANLESYVKVLHGLSIPRSLLPTFEEIQRDYVINCPKGVWFEYGDEDRARNYYLETNFTTVEEDLLGRCLFRFDNRPDFILLDSAAHVGHLEFQFAINHLKGPCVVALDDTNHVKHCKSIKELEADPRFTILKKSDEKFGFCFAMFTP